MRRSRQHEPPLSHRRPTLCQTNTRMNAHLALDRHGYMFVQHNTCGRQTRTHTDGTVSPFQGLFDQLLGAGLRGGQDALVVSSFADLVPKDLQDPRSGDLVGQLGRVVGHQSVSRDHCVATGQKLFSSVTIVDRQLECLAEIQRHSG